MSVSNEVCTFEQARNMFMAGIERKTTFYWVRKKNGDQGIIWQHDLKAMAPEADAVFPAYTAAELLEILPDQVCIYKDKGEYCASVHKLRFPLPDMGEGEFFIIKSGVSVANALAAMYVYLKGHQLV